MFLFLFFFFFCIFDDDGFGEKIKSKFAASEPTFLACIAAKRVFCLFVCLFVCFLNHLPMLPCGLGI